jgi:gas vesicle protein
MMRLINFLAGFIVGVVLGGAIVTLYAPQPGSETRERFLSRFEAILEEGRRTAESTRAEAHARLADLKAR